MYMNHIESYITHVQDRKVYLDRRVTCKSGLPLQLTQKQPVLDPQVMQSLAAEQWSGLWLREPFTSCPDDWNDILRVVDDLPQFPAAAYVPFSEELWQQNLVGLKSCSARGADGFSVRDVRMCPPGLNQWVFQMFEQFEQGYAWPGAFACARVVLLRKTNEPPVSPLGVRPITIMGRLYRLWSRLRARQTMAHLCQLAEASTLGAAAGAGADIMAARILDAVEQAVETHSSRAGLVVDIVKAYNATPRIPLFAILLKLGVPVEYVRGFWSMLSSLKRYIEVAGQIGEPTVSTTGVPEGCAYSVSSTLAITIIASHVVDTNGDITPVFYADNWSLVADSVSVLSHAMDRLKWFTEFLQMPIASSKSWLWGSNAVTRKQLRDLDLFQVKHVACDLGCDVSYVQRPTKRTTQKRWDKSKRVLNRLAKRRLPKKYKVKLANTLGWSTAAFGSELVTHSKHQFRSLQPATCRAVRRSQCGANPYLACAVTNDITDPQCADLISKACFWRRFFQVFPDRRQGFLERLAKNDRRAKIGPTLAFLHAFKEAGWTCLAEGWMQHKTGLRLGWVTCSRRH